MHSCPPLPNLPANLATGFSTLGGPTITFDEACQLARQFQMDHLELRCLDDSLDLPPRLAARFPEPAKIKEELAALEIEVRVLDTSCHILNFQPGHRDTLLAYGEWAERLGSSFLRVFDGKPAESMEKALTAASDLVNWWDEERESRGWTVDMAIETHDTLFTGEAIAQMQARLPRPLPILWDTFHTWRRGYEMPAHTWTKIHPWVRHFHIKEGHAEPREGNVRLHLPGEGSYPIRGLLQALQDIPAIPLEDGRAITLCVEWERRWHPEIPPLEEFLKLLPAWLAD